MVVHLSSKLSHLAQSFRPQHHLNSLRHAGGFFDPSTSSHVFQSASGQLAASAAPAAGAGASGATGGAGGAKWSAGSRAPNWGFQVSTT